MTATVSPRARLLSFLQGSGGLAVAIVVMNVATYGFQLVAARRLGPEAYGGVASLMALLMVIGVAQLGLQATAARRIAAEPEHVGTIEHVMRTGEDPDNPGHVLQVMPWPTYQAMTDRDLRAVYEYLSSIPAIPANTCGAPSE